MSTISLRLWQSTTAVIAIGIAGVIHVAIVPQHFEHAPAHGLFFLVTGIVEIIWAVFYLRNPSLRLTYLGVALGSALFILWLLTRSLPVPFGHDPDPVDTWAITCKLSEVIGVLALGALALQRASKNGENLPSARGLAVWLALGLFAAFATYGSARVAEPFLPSLSAIQEEHVPPEAGAATQEHHHPEPEITNTP